MYAYYVTMTHYVAKGLCNFDGQEKCIYGVWNYDLLFSLLTAPV